MSCGKQYIRFGNNIQVLFANKVRTEISAHDTEAHYVHPYLHIYNRISWKTVQMEKCSGNHRTTIAYFLNHGK